MKVKLGKTIRIIRQAKNLGLQSLAKESGISVPFLSLVENGGRQPSLDVLRRIAHALKIPSEALVLAAMGPTTDLTSSDPATASITKTVDDLMYAEDRLRNLLGTGCPEYEAP